MTMTNKQMLDQLEDEKRRVSQEKIQLINTKACVQMLRDCRAKNMPVELINELLLLIVAAARDDWGPDTQVDDFTEGPAKILIINGNKIARL